MTDRELLEAAAKAAGMQHKWHADGLTLDERCGAWNPLTDDGDALRLAARCGISFGKARNADHSRIAYFLGGELQVVDLVPDHGEYELPADVAAELRRAIVRAAAAMQGNQK